MKKLILIGLPGSGKTTVGGLLARQLGLPFRDCDPQVERLAERTVAQLFSSGEECFRRWETAALQALCAGEDCVLATGGGAMVKAAYSSGTPAIGVGAANLVEPYACKTIIENLPVVMERYGMENLTEIIGGAHHG